MTLLDPRPPSSWLVKLRDRFAPRARLSVRIADGVIPYDRNDLVAKLVGRGQFESEELSALGRILPLVRGMIDVGANLGLYTLIAARRVAPSAQVVAFEASPIEYDKLCWTIARNGLSNARAVHVAVSDGVGEVSIFQSLDGAGALNRLDHAGKPTGAWQESRVAATTLDAWLADNPVSPIDLVKIDVEGHELPVLRGAQALLARERPLVLIEMNPSRGSAASDPARIWAFLAERGYRWFEIADAAGRVRPVDTLGTAINLFAVPHAPNNPALVARLVGTES